MKSKAIQLSATYFNCKSTIFNHISSFVDMVSLFFICQASAFLQQLQTSLDILKHVAAKVAHHAKV
jgi:hypothetical protein